ncbi:hypothetical protein [Streptomyces sp. CBMA156]|uniref:hypothetical protein n=1 Tax=Streptomyces sp. CBMA156 TaxID=1930280 RepID=UPI001661B597|nr:hypothetical protein [Streptomyces sp. CBMA156]MBD0675140.1 hypothetical protein [Streptomyces sp. CBMA156]
MRTKRSRTGNGSSAGSTIRDSQGIVRLFSEFVIDSRYDWVPACEEAFGVFPVAIRYGLNTIPHLRNHESHQD